MQVSKRIYRLKITDFGRIAVANAMVEYNFNSLIKQGLIAVSSSMKDGRLFFSVVFKCAD